MMDDWFLIGKLIDFNLKTKDRNFRHVRLILQDKRSVCWAKYRRYYIL